MNGLRNSSLNYNKIIMDILIDKNNNTVTVDGYPFKLIYNVCSQLGDSSCFDSGMEHFILFDEIHNEHFVLTAQYDTYVNEEGNFDNDYSNWQLHALPLK